MKRVIFLLVAVAFPALMIAQNSAVDNLFSKYKGKDGVTTVQISPELFQVIQGMDIVHQLVLGDQIISMEMD